MCGIAGIMTRDGRPPEASALDRLQAALGHRGPDGQGRYAAAGVGMVQTRLAIIDLQTGDQPIFVRAGDSMLALIANGEIYNYLELRAGMPDATFSTRSDCEPPLHLFAAKGLDFTASLRGMYALAIHDPARDRLVLARDPFGIKPLYYAETPSGFAFASEPQAIVAAGLVAPVLREQARDELLNAQFTSGRETVFSGIDRVLPGETLVVRQGRIVERRRRQALPDGAPAEQDRGGALRHLDTLLNESVGLHQRSDVPYGLFFSGGIDSSVILAMMARLNERPVKVFTIGFSHASVHDEREHARRVAATVGAEHVEIELGESEFWKLLPHVAAAVDDPAADYAAVPTYALAAAARTAGIKVVLTGEGGDELFGGYGRYRRAARPWFLGGRPMRGEGALEGMGVLRNDSGLWRAGIAAAEAEARTAGRTRLQVAQATDCADWLPNDLLTKLDRCLMAHGVEGRVPFIDTAVAAFAMRLPDRLKIRRRLGKWLLRKWLETGLPAAKPFSRKRGFTVPAAQWIAGRAAELGTLVAREPGIVEACRPGAVERLFAGVGSRGGKREGQAAWNLLFFALWHRRHILGRKPEGDAFETLAGS